MRPSNWYLTGVLIPAGAPPEQSGDADEDDDLDEMPDSAGLAEESTQERKAAKKGFFPSSMGLSFLVPVDADTVRVTVQWADYGLVPIVDADGKAASVWQRQQNERTVQVTVARAESSRELHCSRRTRTLSTRSGWRTGRSRVRSASDSANSSMIGTRPDGGPSSSRSFC